MRLFLKPKMPPSAAPEMSAADYLVDADADLRAARDQYAAACRAVAGWNVRHPEYSVVDGKILRQFFPDNVE